MSSKFGNFFLPLLLFLLSLAVYLHNLSRSVYGGDTGDLISAAVTMGVPHPPGYPLYTLLGFILTRIDFLTPAFMVGLISSLSSALSVAIFYLIALTLTKNKLASLVSSLILAFNFLFWFYAEIAEVFSLNVLFLLSLILVAILFSQKKKRVYLFVLSFLAGLSLTNHHTIIFIFPTILIIIFSQLIKFIKKPKEIIISIFLFLLGFSVYLYIPFANLFNPAVNWVPVHDINSFLRLILRSDYGTFNAGPFLAGDLTQRIAVVSIYFKNLVSQLTIPSIVLIVLGLLFNFKKNKKLFLSLLIGFLLSGPLFIGYADFPLLNAFFISVYERFTVMSSVILLLFLPFGLLWVGKLPQKLFNKKTYEKLFIGIFLIIPISLFYYNFPKTDLSKITIGDDFAYDYLSFLPQNTFLLTGGDTPLLNTWYVHYGLGFRKDVRVVNINQLINDSFYLDQREEYLKKNPKDEKDPNLRLKIFEHISKKRPVYSFDPIVPNGKFDNIVWVPYGLVVRLYNPSQQLPSKEEYLKETFYIWDNLRYFQNLKKQKNSLALANAGISDIPSQYANSLLLTGNFLLTQYKDKETALSLFDAALKTSPNYYRNYQILGVFYLSENQCEKARDNLEKAIKIFPFDQQLYYFLYSTHKGCIIDDKAAGKVVKDYNALFKKDFYKDLENLLLKK